MPEKKKEKKHSRLEYWEERKSINLKKQFLYPLITIIIIYLVIHTIVNQLLKSTITPLISLIEESFFLDTLYILGFYLLIKRIFRQDAINKGFMKAALILTSVQVIYYLDRLLLQKYEYNNIHFLNSFWEKQLPHLDFSILIFIAIVYKIANEIRKEETHMEVKDKESFFKEDKTKRWIPNSNENSFSNEVPKLAQKLKENNFSGAFAVGISGDWGSGKSTFLDGLKNQIEDEKHLWIEFNPWVNSNNIEDHFFNEVEKAVSPKNPSLGSLFNSYSKILSDSLKENKVWSIFQGITNAPIQRTQQELIQEIGSYLKENKLKLFITIDDLDRLDVNEILQLLKLIKNTGDFSNTYYLVAFDKTYVSRLINKESGNLTSDYLDKIFQFEFDLPRVNQTTIIEGLLNDLSLKFPEKSDKLEELKSNSENFKNTIQYGITNYRDSIKIYNLIVGSYSEIINELSIDDLIVLQIIRLKFPFVTKDLQSKRGYVISSVKKGNNNYFSFNQDTIDNYLKTEQSRIELTLSSRHKLIAQLNYLFNDKETRKIEPNSIRIPSYFDSYFNYQLSPDSFSNEEWRKLKELNFGQIVEKYTEFTSSKKREDFETRILHDTNFDNEVEFIKLIELKLYCLTKYESLGTELNIIKNTIENAITEVYSHEDYQQGIVQKLIISILSSQRVRFDIRLNLLVKLFPDEGSNQIKFHYGFGSDDYENLVLTIIDNELNGKEKFPAEFFKNIQIISRNTIQQVQNNESRTLRLTPDFLHKKLTDFASQNDPTTFIKNFIVENNTMDLYELIIPEVERFFGSTYGLEDFVRKYINDDKLKSEIIALINSRVIKKSRMDKSSKLAHLLNTL